MRFLIDFVVTNYTTKSKLFYNKKYGIRYLCCIIDYKSIKCNYNDNIKTVLFLTAYTY
jgi:hypothetical protein